MLLQRDGEEAADMSVRYQLGHLRCVERKSGPPRWEFIWREQRASGKRIRRTAVMELPNSIQQRISAGRRARVANAD